MVVRRLSVEVCRNSFMVRAEGLAECRLAKVKVHEQRLGALEGHTCSDVHDGECLTCVRVERGHHDNMRSRILVNHEVEVCSEDTERLVHHVTAAVLHEYLGEVLIVVVSELELPESAFLIDHAWDLNEEWHREASEIALGLHCIVEHLLEEEECERNAASEHECSEEDHHLVRCHRIVGTVRIHDHAGIADIDEGCEFVLLTLLEEEDVEVLGDLLLTLYGEELELLSRA